MQHLRPKVRTDGCRRVKRWVGDLRMTLAVPVPPPEPEPDDDQAEKPEERRRHVA